MVRAAAALRDQGQHVAVIDLTALGVNLSAEQWYNGLTARLGEQLDCEDQFDDCWDRQPTASPLQRWQLAMQWLVENTDRDVTIFIDEIDIVRSLQFSTDEFFTAIRRAYNARSDDARWNRLTFCLLGVASPSDLIQDAR